MHFSGVKYKSGEKYKYPLAVGVRPICNVNEAAPD